MKKFLVLFFVVGFAFTSINSNASTGNHPFTKKFTKEVKPKKVMVDDGSMYCTDYGVTDICGNCTEFHICGTSWDIIYQTMTKINDLFELPICIGG